MFLDDKIFKEILNYSVIPCVDIILIKGKKILLGLRENKPLKGVYYLPGGRIEKGETIMQAAKRKMYEELGYSIDTSRLKFLNIYDDMFDESIYDGVGVQNIAITYAYLLDNNEISNLKCNDSQHNEIKFFDIHDEALNDRVKIRIKDILNSNILNNDD